MCVFYFYFYLFVLFFYSTFIMQFHFDIPVTTFSKSVRADTAKNLQKNWNEARKVAVCWHTFKAS